MAGLPTSPFPGWGPLWPSSSAEPRGQGAVTSPCPLSLRSTCWKSCPLHSLPSSKQGTSTCPRSSCHTPAVFRGSGGGNAPERPATWGHAATRGRGHLSSGLGKKRLPSYSRLPDTALTSPLRKKSGPITLYPGQLCHYP